MACIFAVLLVFFLIASLPLAAALHWSGIGAHGFSARSAMGSIWSGVVEDAAMGGVSLGDLRLGLSPFALLTGQTRFAFSPAGSLDVPRGWAGISSSGLMFGDVAAKMPLVRVLPVAGAEATLALQDFEARFDHGRCTAAKGTATANIAVPEAMLAGAGTLVLIGNPVCEAGKLLLPLTGRTGSGDASLFVRIAGTGAYTYDLALSAADPAAAAQFTAAGFAADGGGWRMHGSGKL